MRQRLLHVMSCPQCGTRPADVRAGDEQSADAHPMCAGCGGVLVEQLRIPWWLWLLMGVLVIGGGLFVVFVAP